MTYDIEAERTDADSTFLKKVIGRKKDPKLKVASQDLDDFLFH